MREISDQFCYFLAVQGDSGHSQINMVTGVYSHIIDDDRRKNAELLAKVLSNPEMATERKSQ